MKTKYSQEFKEQAVQKTLQRGDKSINKIAEELSISVHTLKTWLTHYQPKHMATDKCAKRPTDWTNTERLQALMESYGNFSLPTGSRCPNQIRQRRNGVSAQQPILKIMPKRNLVL